MAAEFFQRLTTFGSEGTATKIMLRIKELAGFNGNLFVYNRAQIVQQIESAFKVVLARGGNYDAYQALTAELKDEIKEVIALQLYKAAREQPTGLNTIIDAFGIKSYTYPNELVGQVYFPKVFYDAARAPDWLRENIKVVLKVDYSSQGHMEIGITKPPAWEVVSETDSDDNDFDNKKQGYGNRT